MEFTSNDGMKRFFGLDLSDRGIDILGGAANEVTGNYIGVDIDGNFTDASLGNVNGGVVIRHLASSLPGGDIPAVANLVSDNIVAGTVAGPGVFVLDATNTVIVGNSIGLDGSGANAPRLRDPIGVSRPRVDT